MTIQEFAKMYLSCGINLLPIRVDKSKAPVIPEWKHLQEETATSYELTSWFAASCGIAAVGGRISGNLEIFDLDNAELFEPWSTLVKEHLGDEFFTRLVIVRTPRPGFHIYTRCKAVIGNQKLAMRWEADPTAPAGKSVKTMIETRGEGGYALLPGSPNACHETGRPYELIQGAFAAIPEITTEERDVLIRCAKSFNEVVREEKPPHENKRIATGGVTPGNDFAANISWSEILKPHGYKAAGQHGDVVLWTRPGKERGISATTNYCESNLFYAFSTNCYPLESERGYNKFSVHTILNHGGDFHVAALALAAGGYGKQPEIQAGRISQSAPNAALAEIEKPEAQILEVRDVLPAIVRLHATGLERGKSTGWSSLDPWYTVRKREWTLITGQPNHGKSVWLDNLMVNLARIYRWKFGIFSAENMPIERYVASFMELYTGKPFSKGYPDRLTLPEVQAASVWLQEHFKFINPALDQRKVDHLLAMAAILVEKHGVDALVLDPWNELDHGRPSNSREDEYISVSLSKIRDFTRRSNVHFFIVAHPAKSYRDASGKHPIPTMYDVKGASEWNAKADNGICVWRDMADPDKGTDIHIQKVRFREVGKAGGGCNLKYDSANGRFIDLNHRPKIDELVARQRQPGDDDD